jgi:hypothetical protein
MAKLDNTCSASDILKTSIHLEVLRYEFNDYVQSVLRPTRKLAFYINHNADDFMPYRYHSWTVTVIEQQAIAH